MKLKNIGLQWSCLKNRLEHEPEGNISSRQPKSGPFKTGNRD
jgi:hypothetical protein